MRFLMRILMRILMRSLTRRIAVAAVLLAALCTQRAIAATCTLSITSPLNFGTYTGTQIRSTTPYVVTCPGGSWDIPMNAGMGVGATETLRYLTGPGGAELGYEIFRDSAYSENWGNTTATEETGTGNYDGTIYAQLLSGQSGPPGTYTDTVDTATTDYFTLTVTIQPACSISANPLSFGNYSGALLNGTTTLSVTCTDTTPYDVGLSAGTTTGATVTNRMMTGPGGATLDYSLSSNATHTTNWGNSTGSWVAGTGTGSAQTLTVYGQIPANQHTTSGTYTDTIIATVNY
jgi:spore coat protein U-like protein